jgi:uncharacterized protein
MTFLQMLLLFVAAVCGGTLNSVAGGGTFFTFPALLFVGVSPINAQATSATALLPGGIASVGAYRRELAKIPRGMLVLLAGSSLVGGVFGATLLLHTSQDVFIHLVPFLLLIATVLFAGSGFISARLRGRSEHNTQRPAILLVGICVAQLLIATYGGYFSGGQSILIMTALALMGLESIHEINALKTLLASCINSVAVITFIIGGAVTWQLALLMAVGAIIGGYGGAYVARKINPKWVRLFVILVGVVLTIYFFIKPS